MVSTVSNLLRLSVRRGGSENIEESQWFTKGWTLQELLAPGDVVFVDRSWCSLGTRESLGSTIAHATDIALAFLASPDPGYDKRARLNGVRQAPVALRMSWTSKRSTSRAEDMAYCLLGIVGINMSLLYG